MRFKVGDRVRFTGDLDYYKNEEGVIDVVEKPEKGVSVEFPYSVKFDNKETFWCMEKELQLVRKAKSKEKETSKK